MSRGTPDTIRAGGFHNASIEALIGYSHDGGGLQKVALSRDLSSGANGIRTRDLLLAKNPVKAGKMA